MNPLMPIIAYAALALVVSFLCSILEAVLLSTSRSHIVALADTHPEISAAWVGYKDDPERPLTAILTLNTVAHTVGALGVGTQVESLNPGQYGVAIASAILTLGILLLSEILPKTLGTLYWRNMTISSCRILGILIVLMMPIVKPIEWIRSFLPAAQNDTVTRDELVVLADIAEESDMIDEDEETVIKNILKLRDIEIQSIMTPRVVVTSVGAEETVADVMGRLPIMVHGRMPMYEQDIDNICGLVLRNEILTRAAADDFDTTMSDISRNVHYCRHDDSVDNALEFLLKNKIQLIVVKDQFGGTVGLVTMEDVFETLLGVEIVDELDQEAIEEGVLHEDMRELAKIRYADDEQE